MIVYDSEIKIVLPSSARVTLEEWLSMCQETKPDMSVPVNRDTLMWLLFSEDYGASLVSVHHPAKGYVDSIRVTSCHIGRVEHQYLDELEKGLKLSGRDVYR